MSIARLRSHTYRIYPKREVISVLNQWIGAARFVYNLGLEQRSSYARRMSDNRWASISYATQCRELTQLRSEVPWLKAVPIHILQQSLKDLDRAYQNFFLRTHGYPKFRKRSDERSFRLPDPTTFSFYKTSSRMGKLKLPKLKDRFGKKKSLIDLRWDRSMTGQVRSLTLTHKAGQWFATVLFKDSVSEPVANGLPDVGVDRGVLFPAALAWRPFDCDWDLWNKETEVNNLTFGSQPPAYSASSLKTVSRSGFDPCNPGWSTALVLPEEKSLKRAVLARKKAQRSLARKKAQRSLARKKAQRSLARKKSGSSNRNKQKTLLAKRYVKEARIRKDFAHKVSHFLSKNHGHVVLENLVIQKMSSRSQNSKNTLNSSRSTKSKRSLNRSLLSSAWGLVDSFLQSKCFWAGSSLEKVSPVNTSRLCASCGSLSKENRKGQRFLCLSCGYETHADTNAAQNIVCRRVGNPSSVCGEGTLEECHRTFSKSLIVEAETTLGNDNKTCFMSVHGNLPL